MEEVRISGSLDARRRSDEPWGDYVWRATEEDSVESGGEGRGVHEGQSVNVVRCLLDDECVTVLYVDRVVWREAEVRGDYLVDLKMFGADDRDRAVVFRVARVGEGRVCEEEKDWYCGSEAEERVLFLSCEIQAISPPI